MMFLNKKNKLKKEPKKINHSSQCLKYKKMFLSGLCEVDDGFYSKMYDISINKFEEICEDILNNKYDFITTFYFSKNKIKMVLILADDYIDQAKKKFLEIETKFNLEALTGNERLIYMNQIINNNQEQLEKIDISKLSKNLTSKSLINVYEISDQKALDYVKINDSYCKIGFFKTGYFSFKEAMKFINENDKCIFSISISQFDKNENYLNLQIMTWIKSNSIEKLNEMNKKFKNTMLDNKCEISTCYGRQHEIFNHFLATGYIVNELYKCIEKNKFYKYTTGGV